MTTDRAAETINPPNGQASGTHPRSGLGLAILVSIWERVLQQSPIDLTANFFDLGGDSLLAIAMFEEIQKEFGRTFPITTIYDAPTIELLATLLEDDGEARAVPLVSLKDGAGAPPFFLIHGIGGTAIELVQLGRALDYPGAVYAIQARGLDGMEPPVANMDAMADSYLREIEDVQKDGPYLLAGYSFGGLIALEIGRRIMAKGGQVGFLGFLDSFAHPTTWPLLSRLQVRLSRARHRLRSLQGRGFSELREYVSKRLHGTHNQRDRHGVGALQRRLFPVDMALPQPLIDVHDSAEAALRAYRPSHYPGKITFFQPKEVEAFFPANPARVWRRHAEAFELVRVPGNHEGIIEEQVGELARHLSARLSAFLEPAREQPPTELVSV